MNNTTTNLYEYHLKQWEEFYSQAVEEGDVNPEEQDENDLAQCYWDEYEYETDGSDTPWNHIHYSAGVYLGEIEEYKIIDHVNNPLGLVNVDVAEVALMVADEDRYSEAGEEFCRGVADLLIEDFGDKALSMVRQYEKQILATVYPKALKDIPETFVTLATWNEDNTEEELVKEFQQHNLLDTLCGLLGE